MIDGAISTLTEDRIILVCEVNGVLRTGSRTIRRPHLIGGVYFRLSTPGGGGNQFNLMNLDLKKTTFDYPVVEDYDDMTKYGFYERLKIASYCVLAFSALGSLRPL